MVSTRSCKFVTVPGFASSAIWATVRLWARSSPRTRRTASQIQTGPRHRDAVEGSGHNARCPSQSDRLASAYDTGGLDGSSPARVPRRADPGRDERVKPLRRRLEQGVVPRDQFETAFKALAKDITDDVPFKIAALDEKPIAAKPARRAG